MNQTSPKHHYDASELHYSSGWCTEDFRLAEQQRQILRDERKQANAVCCGAILDIVESENIVSYAHLSRVVFSQHFDLKETLLQNHCHIKYYIDSRRQDISCGFVDYPYNKVCEMLKHEQAYNSELDTKCGNLLHQITDDHKKMKAQELEIARLRQSIEELQSFSKHLIERNQELLDMLSFEELDTR